MRSKRLLTMLLAVAMVVSMLTPAAAAVQPANGSVMRPTASQAEKTNQNEASAPGLTVSEQNQKVPTLRDNSGLKSVIEEAQSPIGSGSWTAEAVDSEAKLPMAQLPECIAELREAAQVYAADDVVAAFVVMEEAPLSERFSSKGKISLIDEEKLLAVQNRVIEQIEDKLLAGADLNVRYQFTYLTNSFTIETAFSNLERIAMMEGVKSVFIMPVYHPCTVEQGATPNTFPSAGMTGVTQVWQDLGYTGAGMKIAVIDTGLDLDHPSFAADPELTDASLTVEDIDAVLQDLNAYARRDLITADTLYRSAKVPFAFNYCDYNLTADHSSDMQGDHGTHVSGIAAANPVEGTTVVGMAPDAQIVVMKVFGANGGAYTDDIVAAIEDAMILGCDVVNASLGSPAGFSSTDTEIDLIYERLDTQDIVACISAGNEGTSSYDNLWGTNMNRTQNPDNSAIGQPGTYHNVLTVASADNCSVMADYLELANGAKLFYTDCIEAIYAEAGYEEYFGAVSMKSLLGFTLEYVPINGLGYPEDYYDADGNSLVSGKIAVVNRGEITFSEKVFNAQDAGAMAVIVVDTNYEDVFNFGMSVSNEYGEFPYIPSCIVDTESANQLWISMEETGYCFISAVEDQALRSDRHGGQMSSFSSWGVTPDLRLEPDITGIGGNVYSCYDGGTYGLMSGTSMSSPQVAGVTALVMQYLQTIYPDAETGFIRDVAQALMMSTADPIVYNPDGAVATSGALVSPRQQGAGLVDAYEALTTGAYLSVNGDVPKASMGDSATGAFQFTFEIHNISGEDKTYSFASQLSTEYPESMYISETEAIHFMSGVNTHMLLNGSVSFSAEQITVPADGKAEVTVTIQLSEEDKAYFNEYWANGGYVEGYIFAVNEEGAYELNLPFLGFYGDWTKAPVFDTAYWYDNSFWGEAYYLPEGDETHHVLWTSLDGADWVPGINPYGGYALDEYGYIIYDPAKCVLSPNGDRVMDGLTEIYLSLLRSAKTLTISYLVNGEVVKTETMTHNSKTMYQSSYGQVVPWIYSWYGMEGLYDFTDANGNYLPSGTEVTILVDANVDYAQGGDHTLEFTLHMDTQAPELVAVYEQEYEGARYMIVEAKDDTALAAAFLMNLSGTQIYAQAYDYEMQPTEEGTYLAYFDVTGMGTEFQIALGDYGANESYFTTTYTAEDGNLPVMDTSLLYAYRVFDNVIYSDSMYGWVSMNKPTTDSYESMITTWTDDSMEYAAINAAEYAAGKIFAIDAVGNLMVVNPGLFDRNIICNLGFSALDMTFDDSTDTMYVLGTANGATSLYSLDLTNGQVTELAYYEFDVYGPWAIADDDNGTIYAIQLAMSNLFTLDAANGYSLVPVTTVVDGAELEVMIYDSWGEPVNPAYAQSLTYSDGYLYWAYYTSGWMGDASELITINTADWSFYSLPYASEYYGMDGMPFVDYPITELVGLLTLTETDYTLPEATALTGLNMNQNDLILLAGETAALNAVPTPWYYELGEVVWTSSDETVATVVNGMVTAVGAGVAQITAVSEGMSATSTVTVVEVDGSFYAYNYYSGDNNYGYMIDVDLGAMNYSLLAASPVDFIAADYNGHDGYYYGYTEGGQFWRYNLETGEYDKLGAPHGTAPTDMAYDYSTGMMYATTVDFMTGASTISMVNLSNGALEPVFETYDATLMTLAIDGTGTMYSITAWGELLQFAYGYDEFMGMEGLIPTVVRNDLGELFYAQSMCWDHANNVLLWTCPETSTVLWIDPALNYVLNLGDPSNSGLIEFVGMFTVPETIMELPYTPVESVEASDLNMLVGATVFPNLSIQPLNATNTDVIWTSSDASVVTVNADGSLTGVAEGTAVISGTLTDGETVYELSFTAKVLQGADNLYGYVMTDLATYGTQYWVRMYAEYSDSPDVLASFEYLLYAEEYVDGKLYAYGYDPANWEANMNFFVIDAESYQVLEQYDLGVSFPFVYDMTYDYTTGTMYGLVGAAEDDTDLYMIDMQTGAITLLLKTEPMFMSLSAGADGTLYAIENSVMDPNGWGNTFLDADLYAIDVSTMTVELVGSTGIQSNMIASMAYDYDTDRLYWTPFLSGDTYVSSLAIVDPQTGEAMSLGTVGTMGAQVSGLYIVSDNFPEQDNTTLKNLILSTERQTLTVGETFQLNAMTIPSAVEAPVTWKSSRESVATVDESGNVTAVAPGKTTITAKITVNGVTKTATCTVSVLAADAAFLSWNATDGGWSEINRMDYSNVTNLTEATGESNVITLANIGTEVYGYDEHNQLFKLDLETFQRTAIGEGLGIFVDDPEFPGYFEVRDMAYDAANDRMLVLVDTLIWNPDWQEYEAVWGGCSVYELDLTNGFLTELVNFPDAGDLRTLAVDGKGNAYLYCAFNDEVYQADLNTGTMKTLVSLQTQMIYGDSYGHFSMMYDDLSGSLFLLFTGDSSSYQIHTIVAETGELTAGAYVGEVIVGEWSAEGDLFGGLIYVDENGHVCEYLNGVCQICGEKEDIDLSAIDNPFTDVAAGEYYHEPIMWAVHYGLTSGVSATSFDPAAICTRAQMMTFIWRTAGCPAPESDVNPFTDVASDAYYADAVLWAYENGIVMGTSATTFSPDAKCTRAQAVTFLYRWMGETCGAENPFTDVASDAYYYDAVLWAVENGITAGMSATTFAPDAFCTRGQIMTFLYRLWFE